MGKVRRAGAAVILVAAACGGDRSVGNESRVERIQSGDTTEMIVSGLPTPVDWLQVLEIGSLDGPLEEVFGRVASIAVSSTGDLFVVDRQASSVRVFGPDGTYRATWGRSGQGPGELARPDAGAAVLPDGRLLVRDRGNARIQVYTAAGESADTWPVITGQFINRRPLAVSGDTVVNPDVVNPFDPLTEWRLGLVRILDDGTVLDTLPVPSYNRTAHQFVARDAGNTAQRDLPFDPTEHWTYSPLGYVVHGVGDAYEILFDDPEGPHRLRVAVDPYPVEPELRAQAREEVLNAMRWLDPTWSWDGPRIPAEKPAFSGLYAGVDGRVWVLRETSAYETEDLDYDPEDPYDTELRWQVDLVLDGFEPDGTPAGSARLPRDIDLRVPPVLKADTLWAVTVDDLGVQRVGKFVLGR